jgi:hypothetical protein
MASDGGSDEDDMDGGGGMKLEGGAKKEKLPRQTPAANALLLFAVGVTIFLAAMTILPYAELIHGALAMDSVTNIRVSGATTVLLRQSMLKPLSRWCTRLSVHDHVCARSTQPTTTAGSAGERLDGRDAVQ